MSKVRIPINPMQVGRVGAYSMYVRNGEQIVRQRNNSSNYGDSASRTEAQMLRRVKWANLVNFYKASAFWMPKAFENKKSNQTMYNAFMAANINQSTVALTKQLAEEGCCVCEALQISKGSLASLDFSYSESTNFISTGLRTNAAITSATTVGQLSAGIIATMHDFQDGDNVAWVKYVQDLNRDSEQNVHPRLLCFYYEFTLDTSSSVLLSAHPLAQYFETASESFYILVGDATDLFEEGIGFALIHTRRTSGLKVSSQNVYMVNTDLVEQFSDQAWIQDCIDSYGVDAEVPLDPSFSSAVVQKVLWNGSVIYQRGVTEGRFRVEASEGGELEIQGTGLNSRDVKLGFFDGSTTIEYTPLEVTAGSWKYILTGNGYYTLVGNKFLLGSLTLSGIETPEELTSAYQIAQTATDSTPLTDGVNVRSGQALCVNYPFKSSSSYPYFRMTIGVSDEPSQSDLVGHNCTLSGYGYSAQDSRFRLAILPTNTNEPCWVEFKGFIIAVCNYEN